MKSFYVNKITLLSLLILSIAMDRLQL